MDRAAARRRALSWALVPAKLTFRIGFALPFGPTHELFCTNWRSGLVVGDPRLVSAI